MNFPFAVLASALFFSAFVHASDNNEHPLLLTSPPPTMTPIPDFSSFKIVENKKKSFVAFMKPSVVYLNDAIEQSRERLLALSTAKEKNEKDEAFLNEISRLFNLPLPEAGADKSWFSRALKRVDVIPAELVLTQSAKESGWGTSRFARDGNNYYGQWCYTKGCGLVPRKRNAGKINEVAKFKGPFESTQAYFLNINTHRAYAALRDIRKGLRDSGEPITGDELANGLLSYSQMGQTYVNEVQSMMKYNTGFWNETK